MITDHIKYLYNELENVNQLLRLFAESHSIEINGDRNRIRGERD